MVRRFYSFILLVVAFVALIYLGMLRSCTPFSQSPFIISPEHYNPSFTSEISTSLPNQLNDIDPSVVSFRNFLWSHIAEISKADNDLSSESYGLNATLRQELGRGTWRLLHIVANKYQPSALNSELFEVFMLMIATMYPCDECGSHFRSLLINLGRPNIQSRNDAIHWLCGVHNIVNRRLDKKVFDCSTAQDTWKCGCSPS